MSINRPAVFLDRDGVLTEERGYVTSARELKIFPFAAECVKQIHRKGYYAIVITNQSGIARGLFSEECLKKMNDFLIEQTGVDAVYYCPHHPEGKVAKYRMVCPCRKPKTGLIEKACKEFSIDMTNSFFVGDRAGDIMAGQCAGIRTVLAESGYGLAGLEADVMADYVIRDIRDITELL